MIIVVPRRYLTPHLPVHLPGRPVNKASESTMANHGYARIRIPAHPHKRKKG